MIKLTQSSAMASRKIIEEGGATLTGQRPQVTSHEIFGADKVGMKDAPVNKASVTQVADEPTAILYCPNCSTKLAVHKCKLICTVCGYYLSCSDYV